MKLDKEMVLKHKFWFLLLLTLPLSLGSLFLLVTAVSGDINRTRTTLENEQKKIKPSGDIRTPADIALVRHLADVEKAKEKVVHAKAFAEQEELFTWPKRIEDRYNFHSGLFAQQIKIKRGTGAAETSKDEERLIHGVVTARGDGFIEVEGKDKRKHKFLLSPSVLAKNAVEGDEKVKDVDFAGIIPGDRVAVAFQKGKYFGEPLTDREQADYIDVGVYLSQIDSLLTQVDPMNAKGEGVVQLRMANSNNWYYKKGELPPGRDDQKFLIYLDKGWEDAQGEISEEAWLAQEDLWIQHEVYRLIRLANDSVSKFDGAGGEGKDKVYKFSNPFWELGIKWSGGAKLNLTIKNQKERRQKLDDLSFRVRFSKTMAPETFSVGGGRPLNPHETRELTIDLHGDNPARKGIFGVEQVLTWETAAVKRIDAISIGSLKVDEIAMSQRNYSDNQQSLKNDQFKPVAVVGRKPPKGGFDDRDDMRGRFGKKGGKRQAKIEQAANEITKHGLIRNRYSEVNPQVARRVPVGLALIVDQDHIDKVETAFNNSKLRFLTTQLAFNRFPGSLRPQLPVDPTTVGGTANQRYLERPSRPGDPGQPNAGGADDMETNIEMLIYGIVTLYERYPPPLFPATGTPGALPK